MTWQVLILISIFTFSVAQLLQRVLLKEEKSDPITYLLFFQFVNGVIVGVFGLSFGDKTFSNFRPFFLNLILMMVLNGLGAISQFKALKYLEASKFTVIFASRALVAILASSLLLNEGLSAKQWLGTLLILAGVFLVNIQAAKISFSKKESLALLSAIAFGFANVNDRFLLKSLPVYPYVILAFILPGVFIAALFPDTIKKMKVFFERRLLKKMFLLCLIFSASSLTFFASLAKVDSASKVLSINLTTVIVTVLLAIIFLKERENLVQKLLGAFSSFLGLFLVSSS